MREQSRATAPSSTISVRGDGPGVVLVVDGRLDDRGAELLAEVVRAALVSVRRTDRIRIDVSGMDQGVGPPPEVLRRLERTGAKIVGLASTPLVPGDGSDGLGAGTRSTGSPHRRVRRRRPGDGRNRGRRRAQGLETSHRVEVDIRAVRRWEDDSLARSRRARAWATGSSSWWRVGGPTRRSSH